MDTTNTLKNPVEITLQGCEGDTRVTVDLSAEELAFVQRLKVLFDEASKEDCQPVIGL